MADLSRSAKLGSDWSPYELMAYNISIVPLLPDKFFTIPDPPLDHIDPAILDPSVEPLSDDAIRYLRDLHLASEHSRATFVASFATRTLMLLELDDAYSTLALQYHTIPLTICGDTIPLITRDNPRPTPQMDVCIINVEPIFVLLVLVVDKAPYAIGSMAHVIAGAIAAFQFNNEKRKECKLKPLDTMTIPCVTMAKTRPTFYLVPVTTALSDAVISGTFPATPTEVTYCPTIGTHTKYAYVGAEDIEYRKLLLKRFLAFKALAKIHWEHILEGVSSAPSDLP